MFINAPLWARFINCHISACDIACLIKTCSRIYIPHWIQAARILVQYALSPS
nr:MAG TPA: hypothetical protein [Caudoviricetes sp.]DAZ42564.1 MAG TPA: hypothetical protein [Caudoviricetes sp.]